MLVTNNGPPFTSQVFEVFLNERGIRHVFTPPYHPKPNGLAENFVKTFKTALRRSAEEGEKDSLRDFLSIYRVTPHATTGRLPCEPLNNRHYRSVLDLTRPSDRAFPAERSGAWEHQKRNYNRRTKDRNFTVNQKVWMLDSVKKGHWKTGVITTKQGAAIYTVNDSSGNVHRAHKDHLKRKESTDSWNGQPVVRAPQVMQLPLPEPETTKRDFPLPFPEVDESPGESSDTCLY